MISKDPARTATKEISRARQKKTGEVFTPENLILHMFSKSPENIRDINKSFFEPAAGDGNIVIAAIKFKLDHAGWTLPNASLVVSNIYACEYMKDNRDAMVERVVSLLKERGCWDDSMRSVLEKQIAHCNTLDHSDVSEGRKFPDWLCDNWMEKYE